MAGTDEAESRRRALAKQAEALSDCTGCQLSQLGRTQVVFGVGNPAAELLFVGEGPGFNEDKQGEPFVGQAGKLLNELLGSIGLAREDVYIANVVKCRPPGNRDPLPEEIAACQPHLFAQIEVMRPRVVCTLGRFATRLLADTSASMSAVRGKAKEMEVAGVPVIVFPVFHPAAALYTPANRAVLEEDFRKLKHLLRRGKEALAAAEGEPWRSPEGTQPHGEALPAPSQVLPASADGSAPSPQPPEADAEQLPLF